MSSGIARNAQTSGSEGDEENVNFYQLEYTVSTSLTKTEWLTFFCVRWFTEFLPMGIIRSDAERFAL